jgi:hypothetical protein
MLIRVVAPHFVAGAIFGEDGRVQRAAPILKWSVGMTEDELRAEIKRRGYTATIVRTLTRPEITGKPARIIRPGDRIEADDD